MAEQLTYDQQGLDWAVVGGSNPSRSTNFMSFLPATKVYIETRWIVPKKSEIRLENWILMLARNDNEPVECDCITSDPTMDEGIEKGYFVFTETDRGLTFELTEKGLEKAKELAMIYNL